MTEIDQIKDQLIADLWLPLIISGGNVFFPLRRSNKKMKCLTLTNDSNYNDVIELINNKLTKTDLIFGWHESSINAVRLDSEGKIGRVYDGTKYEDSIALDTHDIVNEFPFTIINLDFTSQSLDPNDRSVENEIIGIEHSIKLQAVNGGRNTILIYTSLLDDKPLGVQSIKEMSDDIRKRGWDGLCFDGLPTDSEELDDKIECIKQILIQLCSKYDIQILDRLEHQIIELSDNSGVIISVAGLLNGG